ncbi:MAG: hypothetical protein VB853_04125 [Pirellulales bacterium]
MTPHREQRISKLFRTAIIMAVCLLAGTISPQASEEATVTARENTTPPNIQSLSFGFAGRFKVGYWTPVRATISCGGATAAQLRVDLIVPDSDGVSSRTTTAVPANSLLEAGGNLQLEMFTKIGRLTGVIEVILRDGQRMLDHRTFDLAAFRPLPSDTHLVLAIGDSPSLTGALASREAKRSGEIVVVQMADVDQLPGQWYGYDGISLAYLSTSRPTARKLCLRPSLWRPLRQWIDNGGRFVLSADADDKDLFELNSPLGELTPGRFESSATLPRMNQLEIFARSNKALQHEDELGRPLGFHIARLTNTSGRILAHEGVNPGDLPTVVRTSSGFGDMFFIAVDLESDAFAAWDGTRNLILDCFRPDAVISTDAGKHSGELSNLGYNDLSGQLRAALGQFQHHNIGQFPVIVFFLLAAVYIALIGPADYFFLKRYVGRMEWTWISFPLVVIAACTVAYWMASSSKSERVVVNQVDLVDVDQQAARYRSTSWACMFSPKTSAYDIGFDCRLPDTRDLGAAAQSSEGLLSWSGVPGRALGAMESSAPPPRFDAIYGYDNHFNAIAGLPVQVWSTKNLSIRATGSTSARIDTNLAISKTNSEQTLEGTITNRLGVRLSKCVLLYDRWTYTVGTIDPGQTIAINKRKTTIRTVNTYLTSVGDWRIETNQQRMNPARVLSRMMFYHATGGDSFTPLANNYQAHVDFTHLLHTGKAILLGTTEEPAVTISRDDQTINGGDGLHYTVYRFVFSIDNQ